MSDGKFMRTMNPDDYEECPGCGAMVPRGRTADCPICVLKQIIDPSGPTPGHDDAVEAAIRESEA